MTATSSDAPRWARWIALGSVVVAVIALVVIVAVSGPRGHRVVELQVVDKSGNVVQQLELSGSY